MWSNEPIQAKNMIPSENLECTFSVFKEKQYSLEKPKSTVLLWWMNTHSPSAKNENEKRMKRLNIWLHRCWVSTELERKVMNQSRKEAQHGVIIDMGKWYQIKVTVKYQRIISLNYSYLCSTQCWLSSDFRNLILVTQAPQLKTEMGMHMLLYYLKYQCRT